MDTSKQLSIEAMGAIERAHESDRTPVSKILEIVNNLLQHAAAAPLKLAELSDHQVYLLTSAPLSEHKVDLDRHVDRSMIVLGLLNGSGMPTRAGLAILAHMDATKEGL